VTSVIAVDMSQLHTLQKELQDSAAAAQMSTVDHILPAPEISYLARFASSAQGVTSLLPGSLFVGHQQVLGVGSSIEEKWDVSVVSAMHILQCVYRSTRSLILRLIIMRSLRCDSSSR